jgi:hypothetical protein
MDIGTLKDVVLDKLNKPFKTALWVLTDDGIPLHIFHHEFHIYTPFLKTSDQFGPAYQIGRGYLCHGHTKISVNEPYVGQSIFFWNTDRHTSIPSTRRIRQIYKTSLQKLVPNLARYVLGILDDLERTGRVLTIPNIRILSEIEEDDPHNLLLNAIVSAAVYAYRGNGWSLNPGQASAIKTLAKSNSYKVDMNLLFNSGLISEDRDGSILLSEAVLILIMNGIKEKRPMATSFDQNGLLVMV